MKAYLDAARAASGIGRPMPSGAAAKRIRKATKAKIERAEFLTREEDAELTRRAEVIAAIIRGDGA